MVLINLALDQVFIKIEDFLLTSTLFDKTHCLLLENIIIVVAMHGAQTQTWVSLNLVLTL